MNKKSKELSLNLTKLTFLLVDFYEFKSISVFNAGAVLSVSSNNGILSSAVISTVHDFCNSVESLNWYVYYDKVLGLTIRVY